MVVTIDEKMEIKVIYDIKGLGFKIIKLHLDTFFRILKSCS